MNSQEDERMIEVESHPFIHMVDPNETVPSKFCRTPFRNGYFPRTADPFALNEMAAFIHFRPFAPNTDLPQIDCRRSSLPRCSHCKAYLSPFVAITRDKQAWRCPFCHRLNSVIHFTGTFDMTTKSDRPELHQLVYDIILPKKYYAITSQHRSYIFIVDENSLIDENYEQTYSLIESAKSFVKPTDTISILTYGGSTTIFNLQNSSSISYPEFDLEIAKLPKHCAIEDKFDSILTFLKASKQKHGKIASNLEDALMWACELMQNSGGRAILLTSGGEIQNFQPIVEKMMKTMMSLNIMSIDESPSLERLALQTGGQFSLYSNLAFIQSMFDLPAAWDASSFLRLPADIANVISVMGSCYVNETGVVLHPVIDQTSCVTYSLSVTSKEATEFPFQFAFRFTTDDGERRIRIINGKFGITDFVQPCLDEPSIALFFLRRFSNESNEYFLQQRAKFIAKHIQPGSIIPRMLNAVNEYKMNKSLIVSSSVERFAYSVLPAKLKLNDEVCTAIWAYNRIVISPKPSDELMSRILPLTINLGTTWLPLDWNESEYNSKLLQDINNDAQDWFAQFLNKNYAVI